MYHGSTLYRLGAHYYATGTIKNGRKTSAYYYKLCKPLNANQLDSIRFEFPYVETGFSQTQFAPEIKASILIFPSKAQLKRNKG